MARFPKDLLHPRRREKYCTWCWRTVIKESRDKCSLCVYHGHTKNKPKPKYLYGICDDNGIVLKKDSVKANLKRVVIESARLAAYDADARKFFKSIPRRQPESTADRYTAHVFDLRFNLVCSCETNRESVLRAFLVENRVENRTILVSKNRHLLREMSVMPEVATPSA